MQTESVKYSIPTKYSAQYNYCEIQDVEYNTGIYQGYSQKGNWGDNFTLFYIFSNMNKVKVYGDWVGASPVCDGKVFSPVMYPLFIVKILSQFQELSSKFGELPPTWKSEEYS